jgi:hypothetical protein
MSFANILSILVNKKGFDFFQDSDNENAEITSEDLLILETVARLLGLEDTDLQQVLKLPNYPKKVFQHFHFYILVKCDIFKVLRVLTVKVRSRLEEI